MSHRPAFTLSKADYIAELSTWGRPTLLASLHRLGLKQGTQHRTDAELAELLWHATAPVRERNRATWEAAQAANATAVEVR
jgi:hypothetical protein